MSIIPFPQGDEHIDGGEEESHVAPGSTKQVAEQPS